MTVHNVGVGEIAATAAAADSVRSIALGSCIALVILDPTSRCVSMAHVALPDSSIALQSARETPGRFADTGVPALLEALARVIGKSPDPRGLIVKLAGGAQVIAGGASFDIGRRNAIALKRHLWTRKMGAVAEDLGGHHSRTVTVDVAEGRVRISSPGRPDWEI